MSDNTSTNRKKILVVDDSATVIMLHKTYLKLRGFELVIARNGQEAVDKAKEEKPNLILMDVMMPKKTGVEACREIREIDEIKDTPIILVTTRGETDSIQQGFDAGCTDYVTKPFDSVSLLSKIDLHLE